MEIQKYHNYIQYNQNISEKQRKSYFEKPKRKRIQYYDESDESESYTEIRRRPKRPKKRRILYMKMKLLGFHMNLIRQLKMKKKRRTIFMKVENQNKQKNQKEKNKASQNQ